MRITVLGSGTSVPRPGRGQSGLLVREGGRALLLDGGSGTLSRMADAGQPLESLDAVLYTHLHVDHCCEIVPILFALKNPDLVRDRPLDVYAPPAFGPLLERLRAAWGTWIEAPPCGLGLHAWEEGRATDVGGGWAVTTARMRHGADAHGLRLQAPSGAVLTYSGDTDECDAIVDLAAGADVLVLECSHPDERKVQGHLSPTPCGEIAAKAGVGRLVLTHFYPGWDPEQARTVAAKRFSGPIDVAVDGLEVTA